MTNGAAPPPPRLRLTIGVTGHRAGHASFAANEAALRTALSALFDAIAGAVDTTPALWGDANKAPVRLHSLLANGTDQIAAELALVRQWELVAPLPFGQRLNEAINALPSSLADAKALLAGDAPNDAQVAAQAAAIRHLSGQAHVFELADGDEEISALFLDRLAAPTDFARGQLFAAEASVRVAQAGRILIEQSDIIVGVWDGVTTAHVGGTGHTIATALAMGAPVIWIDPAQPMNWRLLRAPESLASRATQSTVADHAAVAALVSAALRPDDDDHPGVSGLEHERWRPRSNPLAHAYRRVEALFGSSTLAGRIGSLRQLYANPAAGPSSSAETICAEGNGSGAAVASHGAAVQERFRWADGVSARLSDAYRGGMTINFLLSSLAIVGGIAYLPLASSAQKWGFALFELLLLCAILLITWIGQRGRWHGRWFETRRVAEYLRHAPLLLALGAARAPGRWPRGSETSWPEFYVRHVLRDVGLPRVSVTPVYLRCVLSDMLDVHVRTQREYHIDKAERLNRVHHGLDHFSTRLFQTAVATVTLYLLLRAAAAAGLIDAETVDHSAKLFTVLGVLFPTFGAGIAGIRYFGDFERFAAISDVTAQKLDSVHARIALLLAAPDSAIDYASVAELAHATDDIVFAEIESWQAVFGGKHMTVPV